MIVGVCCKIQGAKRVRTFPLTVLPTTIVRIRKVVEDGIVFYYSQGSKPMGESKISCPKCGGHVAFPKEIAGQAASCPHCQEPIILGTKSRAFLWVMIGAGFLCAVAGCAVLFWQMGRSRADSALRPSSDTTRVFAKKERASVEDPAISEDDRAIETLCRAIYARCNERDFNAMHELMATPCKSALTADEIGKEFSGGGASYRFVAMESITYSGGPSGKLARARFRRFMQDGANDGERVLEFKCVKELQGWKLFRDFEWARKIVAEYARSGLNEEVRSNVEYFCASNPFDKWPANATNAFEKIYDVVHPGAKDVFPWNLSFSITTNYVDVGGSILKLTFSIRNSGDRAWENPGIGLGLGQRGKQVAEGFELLSNLSQGSEVSREVIFILKEPLQENMIYELDVSYTLSGGEKCFLAAKVPVQFRLKNLAESVKFEVIRRSFDTTKSLSGDNMFVARVDYRLKNAGNEPLKQVQLRFVWLSLTGEVLDQTAEYAVSYSDLPLTSQQTKTGFVQCGKGYAFQRVPVKVDIYLEDGERRWPLYKSMLVQ